MTGRGIPRALVVGLLVTIAAAAGCRKPDNSAETDRASDKLRAAQSEVNAHSKELATNASAIEQQKRDLAQEQRDLAAKEALLVKQREQLGSAQGDLQAARGAYAAAVKQRFAKLEPLLATLATKSDAASRDAAAGLRARHDQLASKISAMGATPDAGWVDYTKDVDTTFDAIEKDLHAAVE